MWISSKTVEKMSNSLGIISAKIWKNVWLLEEDSIKENNLCLHLILVLVQNFVCTNLYEIAQYQPKQTNM